MNRIWIVTLGVIPLFLHACSSAPGTHERTVQQGGTGVAKACTERPPSTYTKAVEGNLKAALPLAGKTEIQAEGVIKQYLDQHAGGTKRAEDLQSYMFYLCQMSNNGGWSESTTERLINLFMDKWPKQDPPTKPQQDSSCIHQLEEGYALKDNIDKEYWQAKNDGTFQDRRESLIKIWNRSATDWGTRTEAILYREGGPIQKGRFRNATISSTALHGTNVEWNSIRNFLQGRLLALETICLELPRAS